jgi:D-alanyl-D-alanine carboxypeptidase
MTIPLRALRRLRLVPPAIALVVAAACAPPPFPLTTGKVGPITARISISQFRDLSVDVQQRAFDAAKQAHAGAALLHGGTLGLHGFYRAGVAKAQAPPNARWPFSSAAIDPTSAREVYGKDIGDAVATGSVVLAKTSAGLFGLRVGDVAELVKWSGGLVRLGVVAVVDDERLPAELLVSTRTAAAIGFVRPTSVLIYNYPNDATIDNALTDHGLRRSDVRISRGGSSPTPDSTLGLGITKARLGQFWYIPVGDGTVTIDPVWRGANVVRTVYRGVAVAAWCHRVIVPAIQGALSEIATSGLAGTIDLANTNRYGGCFAPREVRAAGGTTGGSLSRHTWAMALDMNTATNPMGGVPTMDCRVVRIFRKWGFAWGGNFTTPDGMHFEWVGEDRSKINYPSTYCPNIVPSPLTAAGKASAATAGTRPTPSTISLQEENPGDE